MNQTAEDLKATVFSVLAEIAPEADAASVDPKESLREQLDLDSMDFLNFAIGLNRQLGVEIPEADYPKLASLDGAVVYLQAKG